MDGSLSLYLAGSLAPLTMFRHFFSSPHLQASRESRIFMNAASLDRVREHVGMLWVVYSHPSSTKGQRAHKYIEQAIASAAQAERLNPRLPRAIATNVEEAKPQLRAAFNIVMSADDGAARRGERVSPWLPRLLALASSPFELTLEVDSTVTVCSRHLHLLLTREVQANQFDLAVNFEAVPLLPPPTTTNSKSTPLSAYGRPPRRVSHISPHNFALLVRKGVGWANVLTLWLKQLKSFPDDQVALRSVMSGLEEHNFSVNQSVRVRVWRLKESFLGLKAADKRRPSWQMIWPRYSRPVEGEVQLIHSHDPRGLRMHNNICQVLNNLSSWRRMMIQSHSNREYRIHTSRAECLSDFSATQLRRAASSSTAHVSSAFAHPLCNMLPRKPILSSSALDIAEPLTSFWHWLRSVHLTADSMINPNSSSQRQSYL